MSQPITVLLYDYGYRWSRGVRNMGRMLPIGIQDFEKQRRDGYVYVDKTTYIYRIASISTPFFLSRPRRFGKSLLVSTLKYYLAGRKDLFERLAIERLAEEDPGAWEGSPVFHLDFDGANYQEDRLEDVLGTQLARWMLGQLMPTYVRVCRSLQGGYPHAVPGGLRL